MRRILFLKWLRDVSIAHKLYFTVGIMALLIGIELFALFFSINTLSSVRAYVGGEGLYAKAQKNAIYHLYRYGVSRNETEYEAFNEQMKVPLGDHDARMEMMKEKPNWDTVRKGFIQGRNHPDDVDGMIKLMRRFNQVSYISKAIEHWEGADREVAKLIPLAQSLHAEINSDKPSQEKINKLLDEITPINSRVSYLQDEFSFTLGEGSRWLEKLVLRLLFIIALTVEVSGLLLAIILSRDIQKGLNEIINAAASFAKGNYSTRARVYSKDEIGVLANAFNDMNAKLEKSIFEKEESERRLQNYNVELEGKNKELEQFAYVASHDLQEPLRTVSGFVDLLNSRYKENLDKEGATYLKFITEASTRMKNLIKALLDYSRIGKSHQLEAVDLNVVLQEVKDDLKTLIEEKNVTIIADILPTVKGFPVELKLLLQNLINNAIKFQKPGTQPKILISAYKTNKGWQLSVKDNGIGIEKENWEKIFVIFQRLHLRKEYDGTGIGLSQCSKIAHLHNGRIWVESEFGTGSTFYFTINTVL